MGSALDRLEEDVDLCGCNKAVKLPPTAIGHSRGPALRASVQRRGAHHPACRRGVAKEGHAGGGLPVQMHGEKKEAQT